MNRNKKLFGLLGILAIICIATIAVTKYEVHKEKIKNSDTVILELSTEDVTALAWKNKTTELSFHKEESWIYDEDEAFPVDAEKIEELLSMFKEFGVSFIIEDVENYSQYGLDNPVCTIQITTGGQTDDSGAEDGGTLEISLGNFSKMDSKRYVSIGDGNVYLVNDDPLDQFDAELSDVVKHDEVPAFEQVNEIIFSGDISYHISYETESGNSYQKEDIYFMKDGNNMLSLDTSLVDSYLKKISKLSLKDYATYNVTDEELASYGLDAPDLSITIDYTHENDEKENIEDTFVLQISRDPGEKEESGDEDTKDITAYARVGASQIIYRMEGSDYQELMKATYNDLRHQNVFYGEFDDVMQIDISLDGNNYTITSEKDGDERLYYYGEEELDVADIRSKINGLAVEEFTESGSDGKEEIRLTLYMENESFSRIEIVLYRHDGETCLAKVNGNTVAYVSRAEVVDLIEAVYAIVL